MNKMEIKQQLSLFPLAPTDYLVHSGAAMVLWGIKEETPDIDLAVEKHSLATLQSYPIEMIEPGVYRLGKIEFGFDYFEKGTMIDGFQVQTIDQIIALKRAHNRDKDREDLKKIDAFLKKQKNVLTLAYMGDAVYEVIVRKHLIEKGFQKGNILQKEAVSYVSAKAQSQFLKRLLEANMFTDEELAIYHRARNHKVHSSPKNTDILTYKHATALEAVIGYLYLTDQHTRIEQLMHFIKEV